MILANTMRLSVVDSKINRIRSDANEIESVIGLVAELHRLNPVNTPCADLRTAARACRAAAQKLDAIAASVKC